VAIKFRQFSGANKHFQEKSSMAFLSAAKPVAKQKENDPIVRLGDVRDLTGFDPNGHSTDEGTISGNQRKT
jgi:hypothetical protein